VKCQNCQQTVTRKTKFCPNCGATIVLRAAQKSPPQKARWSIPYALGLVALGIVVGYVVFKHSTHSGENSASDIQNNPATQSAAVLDIAREFMCPCGTCNDALDECTCDDKNGAVEVKSFIAQKLLEGHKKPHIVEMVQTQYGGLKTPPSPSLKFKFPGAEER